MLRLIQRITTILLMLFILSIIVFFLIYPNLSEIKIFANQFNLTDISRNTSLKILAEIGQPPVNELIIHAKIEPIVENITPAILLKYQNEGNVIDYLEPLDTVLKIPSADIEGKVFDGTDSNTLFEGIWHFPLTPAPGTKGNSVFIAHRFDKIPPETDTFFNLDKVQVGDKISIQQSNGKYIYIVMETKVVDQTDRSILDQTNDYRITLVTCTPLWTDLQRLVVVAKLDRVFGEV